MSSEILARANGASALGVSPFDFASVAKMMEIASSSGSCDVKTIASKAFSVYFSYLAQVKKISDSAGSQAVSVSVPESVSQDVSQLASSGSQAPVSTEKGGSIQEPARDDTVPSRAVPARATGQLGASRALVSQSKRFPSGYCYLGAVRAEHRGSVAAALGSRPTFNQLLSLSQDQVKPVSKLSKLRLEPSFGGAHLKLKGPGASFLKEISAMALKSEPEVDAGSTLWHKLRSHRASRYPASYRPSDCVGRTTLPTGYGKVVVVVDVPDPDNFMMVLSAIRKSDKLVHVMLTARPVDFGQPSMHDELMLDLRSVRDRGGGKDAVLSIISPKATDLGMDSRSVCEDTELYMQLSAIRMRNYLQAHGVDSSAYCLYLPDEYTTNAVPVQAVSHAFHKADFSYCFGQGLRAHYDWLRLDSKGLRSDIYRAQVRRMCIAWINEQPPVEGRMRRDLVELLCSGDTAIVYAGGPMTDVLPLVETGCVRSVCAMLGSWNLDVNLFDNQFNIGADVEAAKSLFAVAKKFSTEVLMVPTDVLTAPQVKFTVDQLRSVGLSSVTMQLYAEWGRSEQSVAVYDWLAFEILTGNVSHQFLNVKPEVDDHGVVRFRQTSRGSFAMVSKIFDFSRVIQLLQEF